MNSRLIYLGIVGLLSAIIVNAQVPPITGGPPETNSFVPTPGGLVPNQVGGIQTTKYGIGNIEKPTLSMDVTVKQMSNGWNLISIPRLLDQYKRSIVHPTSTASWVYNSSYVPVDTLMNGRGIWVNFPASTNETYLGYDLLAVTIPVKRGWNLIGSLSGELPTSSITTIGTTITSNMFKYTDNSYHIADSSKPGEGYWIKVNQNGAVRLSLVDFQQIEPKKNVIDYDSSYHSITFTDATGKSQMLYFGRTSDATPTEDLAELPPYPPENSYDVRFVSNRFIETYDFDKENTITYTICLRGIVYPMTINWIVKDGGKDKISITAFDDTTVMSWLGQINEHSLVIVDSTVDKIKLVVKNGALIPKIFTLFQNYPNPFNPTTVILFDLPVRGSVTLKVYDLLGREVETVLDNQVYVEGHHSVTISGNNWASGVYFYRLEAINASNPSKTFTQVKKMLLIR